MWRPGPASPKPDRPPTALSTIAGRVAALRVVDGFLVGCQFLKPLGGRVQIEFIVATTHFYRGHPSPENELLGLIFGCTALNQEEMAVGSEHSEGHWVSVDEAFKLLPDRHWLRKVITRAELQKANLAPILRDTFRNEGFDIG